MRIRVKAGVALVSAIAIGVPLGAATAASAATAPITVKCEGVNNDVAGVVSGSNKTSREILALAGSIVGLPSLPPFPTTVTSDAPEKVLLNSGEREVTLTYNIGVPAQIAALLRDQLKVSSITAIDTVAGVRATATGVDVSVSAKAPDTPLNLSDPSANITVTMKVKVPSTSPGRIFFRPTPVSMKLKIDGKIEGVATVDTATLECTTGGVIASTVVQVNGTPSTPALIDGGTVVGGQTVTIPLLGRSDFLPDDGNPILPDTLRITKGEGGAYLQNGQLIQPTTAAGGQCTNEVELCAPARINPDTPGLNELQSLKFPSPYPVKDGFGLFNPHPLGMKLSFNGETTAEIPLSTKVLGNEGLGAFLAPSAGTIRKALEDLPSIEPGDIRVTRVSDLEYTFEFTGRLAESDQGEIKLADWRTQLDYSAYNAIFAAIKGLTGGGSSGGDGGGTGGPSTPDPSSTTLNLDELTAQLQSGAITPDEYFAKFASALKNSLIKSLPIADILDALTELFPQPPVIDADLRKGEPTIKGGSTGLLCTSFLVQTVATPNDDVVAQAPRTGGPCKVTGRTVKVRVKTVRTVKGKKRTSYRTVKVVRTAKSGNCGQAIVLKSGKLTIKDLAIGGAKPTSQPKKVTITVTAKGVTGKATKTLTVSSKTAAASGEVVLPASLAGAKRITVRISGSGVAAQSRTLLPV